LDFYAVSIAYLAVGSILLCDDRMGEEWICALNVIRGMYNGERTVRLDRNHRHKRVYQRLSWVVRKIDDNEKNG
jgi:hypothetical protein